MLFHVAKVAAALRRLRMFFCFTKKGRVSLALRVCYNEPNPTKERE